MTRGMFDDTRCVGESAHVGGRGMLVKASGRSLFVFSASLMIALGMMACGTKKSSTASSESSSREAVTVQVSSLDDSGAALSLASADSFSGSIAGCLSGYSKTGINESSQGLSLARGDKNCVFKLDAFAYGGEGYNLSNAVWSEGSSFVASSNSGKKLRFSVVKNIDATVAGAQSVSLVFSGLDVGPSQSAGANIGAAISISGADPVLLDVSYIDVSVDATSGAGVFDLKLQCASALVGSGLSATCGGLELSKLRFGLAKNTLPASPSLDECRAVATSGTSGNLTVAASDVVAAGEGDMLNGGVVAPKLTGPATLFGADNLSLVMAVASSDAGGSCKYFPIAITPP